MGFKDKLEGAKDATVGFIKHTGYEIDLHSPKILFVGGTVALVGSLIWMRHAAKKEDEILGPTKKKIADIHQAAVVDANGKPEYSEEQKKELTNAYGTLFKDGVRLYSGPVILGFVSFANFLASNHIIDSRLADTSAALTSIMASQRAIESRAKTLLSEDDYRRVINGEQIERIPVGTVKDPETGEEKPVMQKAVVCPENPSLLYTRYWNKDCKGYLHTGPDYNIMFLKNALEMANRKLDRDGVLWFSDVLEMLRYPVTQEARVVCWKKRKGEICQVSFGPMLEDILAGKNRDFHRDWYDPQAYPTIRLEFNVDGSGYWENGMKEA